MSGRADRAVVVEVLPNARFRCRTSEGADVLCHVSGDMRMKVVRLLCGDEVAVERSPFDPSLGRIVGKGGRRGT